MNKMHETDLADCARPVETASSVPPVYYTSDAVTDVEIRQVFRQSWIGVGRSGIVEKPGDFIALDIAGQNLILLRDKNGRLRAFANTCRHRGARLVDGCGNRNGLRCPFHSWFYDLEGTLISAPHMQRATGFDRSDYGLVSYRAEEFAGFAFVCLSPDAPDLKEYLGDFPRIHQPWPLERLVSVRRQELEVDCNWKTFLEVFNEYYHLPFVHADSIDSVYAKPNPADPVIGAFATQFGTTDGTGGLLERDQDRALPNIPGLAGEALQGARYTWVFPNMAFAANSDALWCYEAYPISAARCRVVQTSCFPPETIALPDFPKKSEAYMTRMDEALAEDIEALVNQQRGLSCPDARPGRFQPDLEPNVAAFARWYSIRMAQS